MTTSVSKVAIAIPAHNEAERIGACLAALAAQQTPGPFTVVVLANNCDDATAAMARNHNGLDIRVIEHEFQAEKKSAGHARRLVMQEAAKLGEIVLTTDADCVPDADWVLSHRAAFAEGVDAVAGRVSADWNELRHHPVEALRIGALEWEYLGLMAQAEATFDPMTHDPAPRHVQRCGANIGITRLMLDRIGGVPAVPVGEDRALLAVVERIDGRVRQAFAPHVTASARIEGRAAGGMADALSARQSGDYYCDAQFDRADTLVVRWKGRRAARVAWLAGDNWAVIGTQRVVLDRTITYFGEAWAKLERELFPSSPLRPDDLPREIARLSKKMVVHA